MKFIRLLIICQAVSIRYVLTADAFLSKIKKIMSDKILDLTYMANFQVILHLQYRCNQMILHWVRVKIGLHHRFIFKKM